MEVTGIYAKYAVSLQLKFLKEIGYEFVYLSTNICAAFGNLSCSVVHTKTGKQ